MTDDRILSVQDVYNVVATHMAELDKLWPDSDIAGPRKIHIVELIDAIKLRLVQVAEKNLNRYESAFEKAARKLTGTTKDITRPRPETATPLEQTKTSMQLAHEAAQARVRRPNA